jgi:hypothetical protein
MRNFITFDVTVSVTVENHDITSSTPNWREEQEKLVADLKEHITTEPRYYGDDKLYIGSIGKPEITNWG